jgi:serine O-acetyltransferase
MEKFPGHILSTNTPSKKKVAHFTESLVEYLFPIVENADAFIKNHSSQLSDLKKQLIHILTPALRDTNHDIMDITIHYFEKLESIKESLLKDARFMLEFDPAAYSLEEVMVTYPGFSAIVVHRLAHELYLLQIPIVPRMMSEWMHGRTGIDINPGARIGCPFFIDHGTGVVIGETTVIGEKVKIYQGVTLGALSVRKEDAQSKRHPPLKTMW